MKNFDLEIKKSQQLIHWLIDGYGRHGIPIDLWSKATYEWVQIHYNFPK